MVNYSNNTWDPEYQGTTLTDGSQNSTTNNKCCYDTSTPILGNIFVESNNTNIVTEVVGVFNSETDFNKWVKLTATVSNLDNTTPFNIGFEVSQGLFSCCDYDIYFDDIRVDCDVTRTEFIYYDTKCPGFKLTRVIDNKKSWVYNPGTELTSTNVYDNIVRENGTNGMNIEQTGVILAGGHGDINRVFAPSVDADLVFRDTDYYNYHNVIEKHSKLVLNNKEVVLQFNMCADSDCVINPEYLIDDDGGYVLDDDGGRIIVNNNGFTFPNLLALENFKKVFQGFWIDFMEQFIPATTIFVSGEKWCNSVVCEEKNGESYLLDASPGLGLSPAPVSNNVTVIASKSSSNVSQTPTPVQPQSGPNGSTTNVAQTRSTFGVSGPTTITVGDTTLQPLDPDLYETITVRPLTP